MSGNIAVIGCGYWGKNLVRNFYQLGVLDTICDLSEDILIQFKSQYEGIKTTQNFKTLLDKKGIKAVVIATPAESHYQIAKEALLAGKDVFVEKPIALEISEAEELIKLAKEKKAILMVGHILEYHPAVIRLKELIGNGELGKVNYIYSNRLNLGRVRSCENILWSFAPHDISIILSLVGEMPILVSACGAHYLQPNIADVSISNLVFRNGIKTHIFVSWLHPYKEQRLVVIGEKKMAVFNDASQDEKLKVYDKGIEWINGIPSARHSGETSVYFSQQEPLKEECIHFIQCIKERLRPRTDGECGLRVLKVLHASQASLEADGAPIEL
jgi:UDP-2-acetamido-3-amino-2,3-dideoxy-glucuronate N-acetyltransferase